MHFVLEPISAKSPSVQADNKFIRIERRVTQPMALFCNSQSFPVPVFRFVMIKASKRNSVKYEGSSTFTVVNRLRLRRCIFLQSVD